jgi:predicted N-acetyltransferase YhbS
LTPARIGDHLAIHQLLLSVFRGPSATEFQLQQDEPGYSPAQRFVVRDGQRIIGHARLSLREMQIGSPWLRAGRIFDLCVLTEFRRQGLATQLIQACEDLATEQGAVLLQTRATQPALFEQQGWFPLGRHCYSLAGPREVLAEMERIRWEQAAQHQASDDLPQLSQPRNPLTVRRWKQTEHAAVQRLYQEGITGLNGQLARSDEYWRWLIARGAYDWFYVAIDGPDRTLFDDIQGHIVGYMFLKGNRIVEMVASPSHERALQSLFARACRDAIEQSATPIRLDAPGGHPLQELIGAAGGKTMARECDAGETWLGKALDLPRIAEATLNPGAATQLSLEVHGGEGPSRWTIEQGLLAPDQTASRAHVVCSEAALTQLLLSHTSVAEAIESNSLRVANRAARESLESCLVPRPLWFSPLDDLLA